MPPSPPSLATGPPGTWRSPSNRPVRVLLVSRHRLMRDAVGTALSSLGLLPTQVAQPLSPDQLRELQRRVAQARPTTGLLVTDLHDAGRLRDAAAVTSRIRLPWVVLTDTATEAAHEVLLRCGAHTALASGTGLGELRAALLTAATTPGDRAREVRSTPPGEEVSLAMRLMTLSAREIEILQALDGGHPVKAIAAQRGVTVGTVRGQVKSVLRKLEVTSQLQAVAIYRTINRWFTG